MGVWYIMSTPSKKAEADFKAANNKVKRLQGEIKNHKKTLIYDKTNKSYNMSNEEYKTYTQKLDALQTELTQAEAEQQFAQHALYPPTNNVESFSQAEYGCKKDDVSCTISGGGKKSRKSHNSKKSRKSKKSHTTYKRSKRSRR